MDIGVSSMQVSGKLRMAPSPSENTPSNQTSHPGFFFASKIDDGSRGFSFRHDGPLNMRMDGKSARSDLTAKRVVNTYSETDLVSVISKVRVGRVSCR
jgi:16S rRNA C1402 N4-methylase RsmH